MERKSVVKVVLALGSAALFVSNVTPVSAVTGQWSANGSVIYYNDGKVGIGNSTPARTLELGNSTSATDSTYLKINAPSAYQSAIDFAADGNSKWILYRPANSSQLMLYDGVDNRVAFGQSEKVAIRSPWGNYMEFQDTINGNKFRIHNPQNGNALEFGTYNAATNTYNWQVMDITKDGNVGIGTANPTKKLSVNGTILAKEVLVSNAASNWPDYVFASDYKLPTLQSVEGYIKENKHLPGIPAASEIGEGVDLGEMQKQQMEKIEELTLYLIQQNKQIESLQQEIELLKEK